MENFRPDKKLKRKRTYKRWRRIRNILENWIREERNKIEAGLKSKGMPVRFGKRRKYPTPEHIEETSKKPEIVLKWYQKLWNWIKNLFNI